MRLFVQIHRVLGAWMFRLTFLAVLVIQAGLSSDVSWHRLHTVREFYFIGPHVLIYSGIALLLLCAFVLRMQKHPVSLWAFVLFPLLSLFDEFWHRTYGIELSTSPLIYWSPAHWPFMLIVLAVSWQVFKLPIEPISEFRQFARSLVFIVIPVRLVAYLLAPLAPYSSYTWLVGMWSTLIPVLTLFAFCTASKIVTERALLLPAVLILAATDFIAYQFGVFDAVYHPQYTQLVIFMFVYVCVLATTLSAGVYVFIALVGSTYVYVLHYLHTGAFVPPHYIATMLFVTFSALLYWVAEKNMLSIIKQYTSRIQ